MKKTLKTIFYFFSIACYALSATVGTNLVLRELLNSGDQQYLLSSEKKSRPINCSPILTVKTHIIPTSDSALSIHVLPSNDIELITKPFIIFVNVEIALIYSSLEFLPSKPRDPPLS